MKRDAELEAEVLAHLLEFNEAFKNGDLDATESMSSPDIFGFGTGAHERFLSLEDFREGEQRDLSQAENVERNYKWVAAVQRDSLVLFATEYDMAWTASGLRRGALARLTGVLEKHEGKLCLIQLHMSFPASDQPPGRSYPTPMEAIASKVSHERPDLRAQAAPDGTVTMIFTDIENSTNLTERLGDTQWLEVLRKHNALVREQVEENGCFEVKSQGDGFMIASQSARRAVHCAIGVQRELARHAESEEGPIRVRMGLHTGEVLKDADDFFGKHVILASRIAGKARGGEILVSSLLKELSESGGDIRFGPEREVELKGLTGRYKVHEVVWAGP
jgi:class 3 adenylate cyclase